MKRLTTRRHLLVLWAMALHAPETYRIERMCAKRGLLREVKVPKR